MATGFADTNRGPAEVLDAFHEIIENGEIELTYDGDMYHLSLHHPNFEDSEEFNGGELEVVSDRLEDVFGRWANYIAETTTEGDPRYQWGNPDATDVDKVLGRLDNDE